MRGNLKDLIRLKLILNIFWFSFLDTVLLIFDLLIENACLLIGSKREDCIGEESCVCIVYSTASIAGVSPPFGAARVRHVNGDTFSRFRSDN